jgi:hypothetical protein
MRRRAFTYTSAELASADDPSPSSCVTLLPTSPLFLLILPFDLPLSSLCCFIVNVSFSFHVCATDASALNVGDGAGSPERAPMPGPGTCDATTVTGEARYATSYMWWCSSCYQDSTLLRAPQSHGEPTSRPLGQIHGCWSTGRGDE